MSEKTYTDGTVVNGPGQLPTRSPRQQDAEVLLRLLNDVESMLGGTNGLTIQLRAALAAAPAQERIDALELEVRQLTEQAAGLRHAPTPQADSKLAPVLAYPPLPDLDGTLWLAIGQHRRAITNFETTLAVKAVDTAVHGLLRAYVDADRAARAPADSVLEDAYMLLQDVAACFTRDDDLPDNLLPRIDAALKARKQGANHD